jgi:uncharacterized repeat protein (TIGR01451 family)
MKKQNRLLAACLPVLIALLLIQAITGFSRQPALAAAQRESSPLLAAEFNPLTIQAGTGLTSTYQLTLSNPAGVESILLGNFTITFPISLTLAGRGPADTTCEDGIGSLTNLVLVTDTLPNTLVVPAGTEIPPTGSCSLTARITSIAPGVHQVEVPGGTLTTTTGTNPAAARADLQVTAPPETPFMCNNTLYQTLGIYAAGATKITAFGLFEVLPSSGMTLLHDLTKNGLFGGINALAYNPMDNFLYGVSPTAPFSLYRIDSQGVILQVGQISGLPSNQAVWAGAVDDAGNYYVVTSGRRLYHFQIPASPAATFIGNVPQMFDIAFNPADRQLYGWSNDSQQLTQIDPVSGVQTVIGTPDTRWDYFGSLYFTSDGLLIGYGDDNQATNRQETLVRIEVSTGAVEKIRTDQQVTSNDGASCSFGVDWTKSVSMRNTNPGDILTYHFVLMNQSGAAINDARFEDPLEHGLTWVSEPYDLSDGLVINPGAISGTGLADLTLAVFPPGESSFSIDFLIPSNYSGPNPYPNQAVLSGFPARLGEQVLSDDPETPEIDDPTVVNLYYPTAITNLQLAGLAQLPERPTGLLLLGLCVCLLLAVISEKFSRSTGTRHSENSRFE